VVIDAQNFHGIAAGAIGNDEGRFRNDEFDARGPADKDNGDRAEAQAERGCGVSAGVKARRDAGWRSGEEEQMRGGLVK
jgi:hypothetical protein